MSDTPIGISQLIERIKEDLRSQQQSDPMFDITEVDLEISFTVENGKNGGIDLKVIKGGADGKKTKAQTIRLKLMPTKEAKSKGQLTRGTTDEFSNA